MHQVTTDPWPRRLVVLTTAVTLCAVTYAIRRNEAAPGMVTFVSALLPVTLVAFTGCMRWTAAACAIGVLGILMEAALGGAMGEGNLAAAAWLMVVLATLTGAVAAASRAPANPPLQVASNVPKPSPFREDLNARREGTAVQRRSDPDLTFSEAENVGLASGQRDAPSPLSADWLSMETDDAGDQFPAMLETLEDIGRMVSMNLDLDTLVPAIVSTAKSSLGCANCRVYLWDVTRRRLIDPLDHGQCAVGQPAPAIDYGIGAWVVRERAIWHRSCPSMDPQFLTELGVANDLPDAVAPLLAGGDVLGVLVVENAGDFNSQGMQLLNTLSKLYGLGLKNAQLFRRVEEMARRDGLTGLLNHSTFQQELQTLVCAAVAARTSLSVVMCDVDGFKQFNDEHGHQAGDDVLREFARLWKAALPDSAVMARYGGEEFIAALPGVGEQDACGLAEFLRGSIEIHPFFSNGQPLKVTASFGVVEWQPDMYKADDLVRVADQRLYAAKHSGRNRVVGDVPSAVATSLSNPIH
ncbi:MAG: sensor domain-containing diguanylate cyclase [Planctomycetaceae bacterium]|nr:sensor domain-containing diguanylate cyclase [Planctomycetaceae bacterium]